MACNPFDDYLHSFEQCSSNKWVKGTYVFRKVPAIYSEFQLNCSGGVVLLLCFIAVPTSQCLSNLKIAMFAYPTGVIVGRRSSIKFSPS